MNKRSVGKKIAIVATSVLAGLLMISVMVSAVFFSLALVSGWLPFMCYAASLPEPDVPLVTYGEFPFTAIYELDGVEYTIEDTVICEYVGSRYDETDGDKHREWEKRFETGPEFILCSTEEERYGHECFVALNIGCSAAQLMGDGEIDESQHAFLFIRVGDNGYWNRSSEEIYESYGVRLISFEMHAQPVENSFIPAE